MNDNQQRPTKEASWTDDLSGKASRLFSQAQDLVKHGNEGQIVIRRGKSLQLLAFPLVIGVIATVLLLWLLPRALAIAALGAMLAGINLEIERVRHRKSEIDDVEYYSRDE